MIDKNVARLNLAVIELLISGRMITSYASPHCFKMDAHLHPNALGNSTFKPEFSPKCSLGKNITPYSTIEVLNEQTNLPSSKKYDFKSYLNLEQLDAIREVFLQRITEHNHQKHQVYLEYVQFHKMIFLLLRKVFAALIDANIHREQATQRKDELFETLCSDIAKQINAIPLAAETIFEDHINDLTQVLRQPFSLGVLNTIEVDLYSALLKIIDLTLAMLDGEKGIIHYQPLEQELIESIVNEEFAKVQPYSVLGLWERGYKYSAISQAMNQSSLLLQSKHDNSSREEDFKNLSNCLMWHYSIIKSLIRFITHNHANTEEANPFGKLLSYCEHASSQKTGWTVKPLILPMLQRYIQQYLPEHEDTKTPA